MLAHKFTLYGGARGPGKSYWLRWSLLQWLLLHGIGLGIKGVAAGLFCETYPELRDRQVSKISAEFPRWLGEVRDSQHFGLGFHIREEYGGGHLLLRNLDDPSKYQSAEFGAIGVDELTKTDFDTFEYLRGSMRWPGVFNTRFLGATNPGGIGHLYVKALWVDSDFTAYPQLAKRAGQFVFIKALPSDNPYLTEDYWEELNSLSPALRKAWVEGDWNAFVGQVFSQWVESWHVCSPFEIPQHWPKWRAVDWGYAAPWCCLWMAKNPDNGRQYVYRELYMPGLTDAQQAEAIKENTPPGENVQLTYADPSMWAKKNIEQLVTSTVDIYAAHGIPLTKADNDRISGKRKVDSVLGNLPDGEPGLKVFANCRNLIRTLPALPYDKVKVEDVDTDAEDHAYDTLRYGLTRYVEAKPMQKKLEEDYNRKLINQRRRSRTRRML